MKRRLVTAFLIKYLAASMLIEASNYKSYELEKLKAELKTTVIS